MDQLIEHLSLGFSVAFSPENVLFCFVGALLGTLVGILPGLGSAATISMLLPLTLGLDPTSSIIMLAGVYYGAMYGGSTTAILINLPGESASVVTAIDGYQMARNGEAGAALSVAAIGSFFAGCVGTLMVAAVAVPITKIALSFGSPEYFALILFGLVVSMLLSSGSFLKASAMMLIGVVCALVGVDLFSGYARYTFGYTELSSGLNFVPVAMGLFGISEIMRNLESPPATRNLVTKEITGLWISPRRLLGVFPSILRGTAIGSFLGALPGGGNTLSAFTAYSVEKKLSEHPERFGKGAIEGVAAPEAANNASAQLGFVPLLTLGLPHGASSAIMLGILAMQGVTIGPLTIERDPELFWGLIASMFIGNLMLIIINLPLVGIWVQLLKVPYRFMFPAICMFCAIGAYSLSFQVFDIYLLVGFGVFGYIMMKFGFEPLYLMLGFVLGDMIEQHFRRSMLLGRGDPWIFIQHPISLGLLLASLAAILLISLPALRKKRKEVFVEEAD